jgi:PASTA domain
MPSLVGKRLSVAEATLTKLGMTTVDAQDSTGADRIPLMSSNWLVTGQNHKTGSALATGTPVILLVKKPSDGQGSGPVAAGSIPDVVCKDLQAAQDTLQAAGFYNLGSEDGTGQARMQILDRDWVVIRQSAKPGSTPAPGARIVLRAVKFGESTGSSGCPS